MYPEQIELDFKQKVSEQIRIAGEGIDRYRVFTPFMFEDGDHLAIVLKKSGNCWTLTDEGHTFMHLTYEIDEKDMQKGTRQSIITNVLSIFSVEDQKGELLIRIPENQFGNALYNFVQALLKVFDITFLSRERVISTFIEDFTTFIKKEVPPERFTLSWFDKKKDLIGNYVVDCKINGMPKPLFIFAINSDDRARDATISLLQFEKWGYDFHSMAIFENQEEINRKVLARLSDVFEKQFSNLDANQDRISGFIGDLLKQYPM
jgi:hypothetical protein